MKNLLFLLLTLFAFQGFAQDKTVPVSIEGAGSYISIDVSASDTITTNLDTVDYKIKYIGNYVKKLSLHLDVDTISGADTVSIELLGYDFADDATGNVIIAADTTNVASTANIVLSDDYFLAADELSFRYYAVRVRHLGVGEGVLINKIEFKVYTD